MKKMFTAFMALLATMSMMAESFQQGEIVYVSNNKYSEYMHQIAPTAKNSLDTIVSIVKGNKIHQYYTVSGTHIVYDPDYSRITIWGDYTKTGYYLPYIKLCSDLYPSMFDRSEPKTILGKEGVLFHSRQEVMGMTVNETFLFVAKIDAPATPNILNPLDMSAFGPEYANMSVIRKIQRTYTIGNAHELMVKAGNDTWFENSLELTRMTPREVEDEEFDVPADCSMEYYDEIPQSEQLKNVIVKNTIKSNVKKMNKDMKKFGKSITEKEMMDVINFGMIIQDVQNANINIMREQGLYIDPVYSAEVEWKDIEKEWHY